MSKEFMTKYNSTVSDASSGRAAIGFFAAQARHTGGRDGVGSFPWSILAELGQLSQPGWYGERNTGNLQMTATQMKAEKLAVGHGVGSNRIIPWLSTATGGYVSPTSCFDELIHIFLNGAFNCLGPCRFAPLPVLLKMPRLQEPVASATTPAPIFTTCSTSSASRTQCGSLFPMRT